MENLKPKYVAGSCDGYLTKPCDTPEAARKEWVAYCKQVNEDPEEIEAGPDAVYMQARESLCRYIPDGEEFLELLDNRVGDDYAFEDPVVDVTKEQAESLSKKLQGAFLEWLEEQGICETFGVYQDIRDQNS